MCLNDFLLPVSGGTLVYVFFKLRNACAKGQFGDVPVTCLTRWSTAVLAADIAACCASRAYAPRNVSLPMSRNAQI